MMNVIKSHDLYPNLFHIEQRRNSLAGLLTQIIATRLFKSTNKNRIGIYIAFTIEFIGETRKK